MIYSFKVFESFSDKDYISIGCVSSCLLPNNGDDSEKLMSHISLIKFDKEDYKFESDILSITRDIFRGYKINSSTSQIRTTPHWNINQDYTRYNIPKYIHQLVINISNGSSRFDLSLSISKLEDYYMLVSAHGNSKYEFSHYRWHSYICDISHKYTGYINLLLNLKDKL